MKKKKNKKKKFLVVFYNIKTEVGQNRPTSEACFWSSANTSSNTFADFCWANNRLQGFDTSVFEKLRTSFNTNNRFHTLKWESKAV